MSHIDDLKNDGYCIIRSTNTELQEKIYKELDDKIQKQDLYVNNEHFAMVLDPYLYCKHVLAACIHPEVIPILQEYLGCIPYFDGANLRRSFITNVDDQTTTMFHRDREWLFMLKVFFYLNDVDMDGGPFTYVAGSWNKTKEKQGYDGYGSKKRFSDAEIINIYGVENVKYLTAKCGDIIIANTTGFHKGLQCVSKERNILTLRYSVCGRSASPTISKDQFNRLTCNEQQLFRGCRLQ